MKPLRDKNAKMSLVTNEQKITRRKEKANQLRFCFLLLFVVFCCLDKCIIISDFTSLEVVQAVVQVVRAPMTDFLVACLLFTSTQRS